MPTCCLPVRWCACSWYSFLQCPLAAYLFKSVLARGIPFCNAHLVLTSPMVCLPAIFVVSVAVALPGCVGPCWHADSLPDGGDGSCCWPTARVAKGMLKGAAMRLASRRSAIAGMPLLTACCSSSTPTCSLCMHMQSEGLCHCFTRPKSTYSGLNQTTPFLRATSFLRAAELAHRKQAARRKEVAHREE